MLSFDNVNEAGMILQYGGGDDFTIWGGDDFTIGGIDFTIWGGDDFTIWCGDDFTIWGEDDFTIWGEDDFIIWGGDDFTIYEMMLGSIINIHLCDTERYTIRYSIQTGRSVQQCN